MGGEKQVYGTYGEGESGNGEIIWNVSKEYRKQKYKKSSKGYLYYLYK